MSSEDSNEERLARQDSRRYSGWTSAITNRPCHSHCCLSAEVLARAKRVAGRSHLVIHDCFAMGTAELL